MRPTWRVSDRMNKYASFVLLAGLLGAGCQRQASTAAADGSADRSANNGAPSGTIEIPRGTQFYVRSGKTVDSAKAKQGDLVEGILNSSIVAGGKEILPVGTKLDLRVMNSKLASEPGSVGLLTFDVEVIHHGGADYRLKASPVRVETSPVKDQVQPDKQIPNLPLTEKQGRANAVLNPDRPLLFETLEPVFIKP